MEIFIAAIVLIVVILVCREVACWYFKINQHLDLMAKINLTLGKVSLQLERLDEKNIFFMDEIIDSLERMEANTKQSRKPI